MKTKILKLEKYMIKNNQVKIQGLNTKINNKI